MTPDLPAPVHALSTMWSQGRFPHENRDSMARFAETASRLGFPAVEINYVIPPEGVEEILASDHVSVASLHSPTPRVKAANGRWSEALNLAAADEEERALAVRLACETVDHAVRAGARYVVVHLGGIESGGRSEMFEGEKRLRRLFDEGVRAGAEVDAVRSEADAARLEGAGRNLPRARRSLAEIAEHAAGRGVAIGLENRYHYHEFPGIDEMHELLADYPPTVAGFWLDVGHAEVLDRLGLVPKERWLDELGARCIGSHVHDVDGLADHRAPGLGDVDWSYIARGLPADAPRVFEINQRTPEDAVAAAVPFLRERSVL
ncbi:MAG TPA: sugar phosphate isomerase/epimerase [Dehalococcoidia bacterium]|nr:sugar phosphate isomerase/epimerase [Dehalococcoidia bacterium]